MTYILSNISNPNISFAENRHFFAEYGTKILLDRSCIHIPSFLLMKDILIQVIPNSNQAVK